MITYSLYSESDTGSTLSLLPPTFSEEPSLPDGRSSEKQDETLPHASPEGYLKVTVEEDKNCFAPEEMKERSQVREPTRIVI